VLLIFSGETVSTIQREFLQLLEIGD